MRRIRQKNDLVIGCYKHLLVARYLDTEKQFNILRKIENVHSNTFSDLAIFKNKVYSVCKKDGYVSVIKFDGTDLI